MILGGLAAAQGRLTHPIYSAVQETLGYIIALRWGINLQKTLLNNRWLYKAWKENEVLLQIFQNVVVGKENSRDGKRAVLSSRLRCLLKMKNALLYLFLCMIYSLFDFLLCPQSRRKTFSPFSPHLSPFSFHPLILRKSIQQPVCICFQVSLSLLPSKPNWW